VVITSVTRDDLGDGGAGHFAETVVEIRRLSRAMKIELLIPDLGCRFESLAKIIASEPDVINHNIETVPRLYPKVRPQAGYARSLQLLKKIKEAKKQIYSKSGFMVGLGESDQEVIATLEDLKQAHCDIVTIGQYLPPSRSSLQPERYVLPETFRQWKEIGRQIGFFAIEAGPLVRSSYHAGSILKG
jgi:lipoic acid synthetase